MFTEVLSARYDSHDPDFAQTLVDSARSYITSKLDHERKTPQFVSDLRRKLYFIHEYNSEVAKLTRKYPWSRKLDLLLIKYVELEFDVLYENEPPKDLEASAELRVLRLLQVMLYPAVLTNENLITKDTDLALKKTVLQLLSEVSPRCLVKDKLVCNIAEKLSSQKKIPFKTHKNLATSDYGSDSDSDLEETNPDKSSDCVEVPVTSKGVSSIPTVEFVDDDNYFVYLQKPKKRKIPDGGKNRKKTRPVKNCDPCVIIDSDDEPEKSEKGVVTFEILDDSDSETNYMVYLQKEVETKRKKIPTDEVIVCSDSEDDSQPSTSSQPQPIEPLLTLEEVCPTTDSNFLIDPCIIQNQGSGDPVMGDSPPDLDLNGQDRINESYLEELLLDDTYLLEGQKEFEELEYFLFNESEKQGFYLDDSETVPPPETFDADLESLESLLNDSQLVAFSESDNFERLLELTDKR